MFNLNIVKNNNTIVPINLIHCSGILTVLVLRKDFCFIKIIKIRYWPLQDFTDGQVYHDVTYEKLAIHEIRQMYLLKYLM